LIGRIWELRHNFTAYEATYIALAEAMNAVLYTSDEKLCKGHRARVVPVHSLMTGRSAWTNLARPGLFLSDIT